jgi:hypothetical protein
MPGSGGSPTGPFCSNLRTRGHTNDVFVNHFRDGKIAEIWMLTDKPSEVDAFLG